MITRAKYEKAVDDAFGGHVSAAFNVLVASISGASPDTKDVATRAFASNVRTAIAARDIAMDSAPEAVAKK